MQVLSGFVRSADLKLNRTAYASYVELDQGYARYFDKRNIYNAFCRNYV